SIAGFFFQAEDGIRDFHVTGVQTCALPILKRVGLLGGSFDPVHQAHLALARAALSELELDQVQFIPAGNPWQRAPLRAAGSHRRRTIERAIAGDPRLAVNPLELGRDAPTYTLETPNALGPDSQEAACVG